MLAGLSKFLFGYDIFISYSYADGRQYAEALEDKLTNLDFSCFLDKKELVYGDVLSSALRRAIRRSRVLLLVGTRSTPQARYVNLELFEAIARDRTRVIPVDVDGVREHFTSTKVQELIWINEDTASAQARTPSAAVLEGVARHFRFTRRNTVTRSIVGIFALFFLLLAVIAAWQWRVAVVQRDIAVSRQLAAQSATLIESEPDLALLLAAEAAQKRDTFEARDALLDSLQSRPGLVAFLHDAGQVLRLIFSPDGHFLTSLATGERVTVWDIAARPTSNRPASPKEANDFIASASSETHNDQVDKLLTRIRSTEGDIRTFAVTSDNRILATSDGTRISLWSLSNGRRIGPPRSAQQPRVRALAFSPDGLLASGSSKGTIALWNVSEISALGRPLGGLNTSANSVAFSEDEKTIAGGDYHGTILVWDVATGRQTGTPLTQHRSPVKALRYCGKDELVSAASEVIRWDLRTQKPVRSPLVAPEHSAVAISPDCSVVALGANDGQVSFLDLSNGSIRRPQQQSHKDRI
jgi:hypothetical protein